MVADEWLKNRGGWLKSPERRRPERGQGVRWDKGKGI